MAGEDFEITDEMRAQFGVDSEPWTYEVTTTSVRMYARGIGSDDPVHVKATSVGSHVGTGLGGTLVLAADGSYT